MNPLKACLAALLCLYYLALAKWAEHQDKARLIA